MIYVELYKTISARLARENQLTLFRKSLRHIPPEEPDVSLGNPVKILRVELKDGFKSYCEGEKYPARFFTPHEVVDAVAAYKRLFSLLLTKPLGILALVLLKRIWIEWLKRYFSLTTILLKEEYWSEPVRELRRVLKVDPTIKDAISGILQHDMAYCYRFQDVLGELNKDNFNKDPAKEIKRLIYLYYDREQGGSVIAGDVRKYVKFLMPMLWIMPKRKMKEFVNEIDLDKIKLSKEDIYWTNLVPNYNYRGIPFEQRKKEYELEKSKVGN